MTKLMKNEKGQGLVEYVILVGLVVIVCVATAKGLGGEIKSKLGEIQTEVQSIKIKR